MKSAFRIGTSLRVQTLLSLFLFGSFATAAEPQSGEKSPAPKPSAASATDDYSKLVIRDGAVAYWRFTAPQHGPIPNEVNLSDSSLQLVPNSTPPVGIAGPVPNEFPKFGADNRAVEMKEASQFYRIVDPGEKSALDFDLGDAITIEAWVNPSQDLNGSVYLIGKGRLAPNKNNQNFAFRLNSTGSDLAPGFLFRSRGDKPGWHRWTSTDTLATGDGWHHVALTYKFGEGKSLAVYIDGVLCKGRWDMDGMTDNAPVVDDDEVWVGTSMGATQAVTYQGGLDEVALYRTALPAKTIQEHYKYVAPKLEIVNNKIPEKGVLVDIYENVGGRKSWNFRPPKYSESFEVPSFGFIDLPKKYNEKALITDRSNPFLMRASGNVVIPEGEHRLLVRSRNSARVYLDGKQVAETPFHSLGGDNGPVFEIDRSLAPNIRPLHRGDNEKVVTIQGDGKTHLLTLETIVGGNGRRPELGETGVYLATPTGDFRLLGTDQEFLLTDENWNEYIESQEAFLTAANQQRRADADVKESQYWVRRHTWAKEVVSARPAIPVPEVGKKWQGNNWIDKFIGQKLEAAGTEPGEVIDDATFLRRVTLDTTGRMPTIAEIEKYFTDPADQRRNLAIDRLLASPEWADHWTGYWQDVLAENPNIINPTLNNTGPFRYWIHESFQDNKPFDRFVTELVMMEGSRYFGGPAGFEMASQNDAPMAAKSHILGEAFLAVEMNCARCHDAPFHDVKQRDLFALSAMLNRGEVKLPGTSTVPGGSNSLLIEITLHPGDVIPPEWPFAKFSEEAPLEEMMRNPKDTREKLALLLTSPHSTRFAPVFVNRLWLRYLGHGFVEKPEDWEHAEPSHPELLEALSREFVTNNYDIKHLARLIFQSEAYQRVTAEQDAALADGPYLFARPIQRRLSAEQFVDSIFAISDKDFDADVMCIDIDTSRTLTSSLNLGRPTRSWQFGSLSNERDRPSLALPFAQPFVTTLEGFGWRSSRQDPITIRETAPTPMQPAEVANGLLTRRICTLCEESGFTSLAMEDQTVDQLVDNIFRKVLTRLPTPSEREMFTKLLAEGYDARRVPEAVVKPRVRMHRNQVAWTNHLHPDANTIKLKLEEEVRQGDPPTVRLQADWRERMEDVIWVLVNSPEFMFVP